MQSTGKSTSDAADIYGRATSCVWSCSTPRSTAAARAHSYLVGLNGTEIGTEEQLGQLLRP